MRIALVSRELYPLGGGGIGVYTSAAARVLSQIAEVTVLTLKPYQPLYERLRAAGDERLPPSSVRVAFVEEPSQEEASGFYHLMHCYSARVYERLKQLYPAGGPDLVEFPDFLGEAFVTVQAAAALDPFLDRTRVCVRLHTTAEICEVLDGHLERRLPAQALRAMERYCLRHADALLWQGGDILRTYRRFYGESALAPAVRIRSPYAGPVHAGPEPDYVPGPSLRLLYVGRLERRKGVHNLVRALTGMAREDVRLTLLGGDTNTAPLGVSMRELLRLEIADDPRIELLDARDSDGVAAAIRSHDAVAVPSLWECWPYAALEALHLNRPVLGTPVGGLVELVQAGRSGWLARGTDPVALEDALESLIADAGALAEMVRSGAPAEVARTLADEREILDGYAGLAVAPPRRPPPRRPGASPPLVSAVIPYYRAARYVRDAVDSLRAQSYPRIEIVLVNDGSFEDEDWVVAELAGRLGVIVVSQRNAGLGAARNFGIAQTRGRYVLPLDADNVLEPDFVARCVEILERDHECAYVTSWSLYIKEDGTPLGGHNIGYEPLGNESDVLASDNVAGDAVALIRRRVFDAGFRYSEELTSFEDWHFYRELARGGHFGVVVPARLFRYRVREDSMYAQIAQPNRERLEAEIDARIRENALRWTSSSA